MLLLAAGIGQRTVWLPPATVTASVAGSPQSSPLTVLEPALLASHHGQVHLTIKGAGPIGFAIGRPDDVNGWVGTAAHLTVTGANAGFTELTTTHADGDATVPNPAGSDLWVSERSATGTMDLDWTPPADGDWSILLSSGGTAAAPTDISVTVPNDNSTPWAVPLMVIGAIALALAALAFLVKPKKRRRSAGPRRTAATGGATIRTTNGSPAPAAAAGKNAPTDAAPVRPSDPSTAWPVDAATSIPLPATPATGSAATDAAAGPKAQIAGSPKTEAIDLPKDASKGSAKDDGKEDGKDDDDAPGAGPSAKPGAAKDAASAKGATAAGPASAAGKPTAPESKDQGKGRNPRMAAASLRARWGAAVAAVLVAGSLAPAHADTATPTPSGTPTGTSTATPSASAPAPGLPVLLENQFNRILTDVANVVGTGDNAKDAKELEPRVAGSALEIRAANYKIRSQVSSYAAVLPVASSKLLTKVVTTSAAWPRTVMAVTQGAGNEVPQVLTLVQENPRENYKLTESTPLLPGETFPKAEKAGSEQLAADSKDSLAYSPNEALAGLSDRLTRSDSGWKDRFKDSVYITDTETYQAQFQEKAKDASYVFAHTLAADSTRVLRTADGGAMVMANFKFQVDATANAEAKLTIADEAAVFAGGKETTTGYSLSFGEPVVLYIPPAGGEGKLTLLSATRELVGATFK
ncbi:hypothetical protein ACQCSX_08015 [Pseudarthrobacter sp. P1]|uniref:hypothetical protein n=1 Tax=Pseudarthrobacter sp. P1 TaxID=3418418 RepID=UPI003CF7772C